MANQLLTNEQVILLVEAQAKERGMVPAPKVFIDTGWCPERLYVGTVYTSLTTVSLILSPELFGARVVRPLLDRVDAAPLGLDPRFEPYWYNEPVRPLLDQRGATHGDYDKMAHCIQGIKVAMRCGTGWSNLNTGQKEALELIATKIGRIVEGNPNCRDHWEDIKGYSQLVLDRIGHKHA